MLTLSDLQHGRFVPYSLVTRHETIKRLNYEHVLRRLRFPIVLLEQGVSLYGVSYKQESSIEKEAISFSLFGSKEVCVWPVSHL